MDDKLRIHKAIEFATIKHANQFRKGTKIPYIVHPFEVAQILTENGCSADVIIAGLLHDTIEDADVKISEIEQEFGEEVAVLVGHESEDKSKTWEERKRATIDELGSCDDDVAMCTLADKLSNLRSIHFDITRGEDVWKRFNRPRKDEEWYYTSIAKATARLSKTKLWQEYSALLCVVFPNYKQNID